MAPSNFPRTALRMTGEEEECSKVSAYGGATPVARPQRNSFMFLSLQRREAQQGGGIFVGRSPL